MITPYHKNAKKHTKKQIAQVAESIKAFGMNQPIVGHGRYEALKSLGMDIKDEYIKTVDLSEEEAAAYHGKGKETKNTILNDDMTDESFDTFLTEAFSCMKDVTKQTAGCYIFHSHKTASDFERALEATGFTIDTQLIWNKPSAGMGMNDYRTKHEPFFYAYLSKDDKAFYGDRTGTTVWKIPADDDKAFKWFKKQQEALEKGETTVWTMSRATVTEYVHPTQKPVELPATAIIKSSKREDIILDPFLGSGTTLIAAEKTGRYCYGIELDPKYMDVIVQRWVDYTGIEEVTKNGIKEIWPKTHN